MAELREVPIGSCTTVPEFNARQQLGDLTELIESIKAMGVQEPLRGKIKDDGETVEIYVGFRRLAAAEAAELTKVPVVCVSRRSVTGKQMFLANVTENIQREDLNAVDEAMAYAKMQKDHSMSVEDICAQLGVKKFRVQHRFRLLKLEGVVRNAVQSNRIPVSAAIDIDRLPKEKQSKFVEVAAEFSGAKLTQMIDKELEKLQTKIPGTEAVVTVKESESNDLVELLKAIKICTSFLAGKAGWDEDRVSKIKEVNYQVMEVGHLRSLARLFGDLCEVLPEEVVINDKAEAEIASVVADGREGWGLDLDSSMVCDALTKAIRERASELAQGKAGEGKKAKVTYAIAEEALGEFFTNVEEEE